MVCASWSPWIWAMQLQNISEYIWHPLERYPQDAWNVTTCQARFWKGLFIISNWQCFSVGIYDQSCGTLVLKIYHNALTIPNQHETLAPMSGVQLVRSLHKGLGRLKTWMSVQHFSMLKAYTSAMSRPTELWWRDWEVCLRKVARWRRSPNLFWWFLWMP